MARSGILFVTILVGFTAIIHLQAGTFISSMNFPKFDDLSTCCLASEYFVFLVSGIYCWDCASTAPFCDDPFDESSISDSDRRWSYQECRQPPQPFSQKVVCKKVKQIGKFNM